MDEVKIGFIGAGTLGKGLAFALGARGYPVVAVSSRSWSSATGLAAGLPGCQALADPQQVADGCNLVFITTPDEAIHRVASQVSWRAAQGVVHCSGAEPLDALEPAAASGSSTGSFHPFQTLACLGTPGEAAKRLEGVTFAIEGQGWVFGTLKKLASNLGGRAIRLRPEDRAIYHASGAVSCGYLVALLKAAADLWEELGVSRAEALPTILRMAETTLANVSRAGLDASVTGPLVRGDTDTLRRHLEALERRLPSLVPLYCSLSHISLPLARDRVGEEKLGEMAQLLDEYSRRSMDGAGS